jgi:hypothetical protein
MIFDHVRRKILIRVVSQDYNNKSVGSKLYAL